MKLVIANWKANPKTWKEAEAIAGKIFAERGRNEKKVVTILCPPFVWLRELVKKGGGESLVGAQDVFYEEGGPYTGEVSAPMLLDIGVRYVIVGHSERRALGDTDEAVNKKIKAVLSVGLTPILCVGEPYTVRNRGVFAAKDFVRGQLEGAFTKEVPHFVQDDNEAKVVPRYARDDNNSFRIIIAYEPVWAISSNSGGISDTSESAAEMITHIREVFAEFREGPSLHSGCHKEFLVLYGGSVNGENAREFLERPEIDGVLVGGASLKAEEFSRIIKIAGEVSS